MEERFLNITVQLPDDRVLLYKRLYKSVSLYDRFHLTMESCLLENTSQLGEFRKIMWEVFGVDATDYTDDFIEMTQLPPIVVPPNRRILPYFVRFKSAFAFEVKSDAFFVAKPWQEIQREIMTKTIYSAQNVPAMHSKVCIEVAKMLQVKRIL